MTLKSMLNMKNGRRFVSFYMDRCVRVSKIFFAHKSIDKYTREGVGRDGIEIKSMIDLVLLKEKPKYVTVVKSVCMQSCYPLFSRQGSVKGRYHKYVPSS